MSIRYQLIIGFSFIILIFTLVFFVNQRLSQEVLTATTYLNNSEAVIRNSNVTHKEILEMQSGFRGYLLTSQESFLTPFYDGLKSLPLLLTEQKRLLSTQSQILKLDSIVSLHKEWVLYADSLISAKRDTLPESNLKYQKLFNTKLKMEVGKKLNDRITIMFASLDNHEYKLRLARRAMLQKSLSQTRVISIVLTVGCIIISFSLGFYFLRTITGRISKMVNFSERISRGEFISISDLKKDEVSRLIKSLNRMSETLNTNFKELKRKNDELDQFAYVVSHDLKTPLRGIKNIISWIEEDHPEQITPELSRNLELIKGRANRMEKMINGLLEYARIGRVKKKIGLVDINELLLDLKELLIPKNVILTIDKKLPKIKAEKVRLEQVFSNLISNAVKYNDKPYPEIKISFEERDHEYLFSVADNGPGIENQYLEKIFLIFQTLKERDAFESTGVGLAIVKKVIEDNNGTIDVDSEIGKGTTFYFTWPKYK